MSVLTPPASTKDATSTAPAPTPAPVSRHIRPRSSIAATIALVLAVASVFTVATGVLAGPGAVLGVLAAIFGVAGLTSTRQRHIAGTGNAVIGLVAGLVALAAGALAVSSGLPWVDPDTNNIARLHDWLELHASWALRRF